MLEFNDETMKRYSRHFVLQNVGVEGQKKLAQAQVFITGAGGLGSPIALYLAAAGVGRIGIIDDDVIDLSNLQRQILHTTPEVGTPKVQSAKQKLHAINPHIQIDTYQERLNAQNITKLIESYDVIVDGTDNFGTKFLINDACVMLNKPYSYGGILRFSGQTMSIKPNESACYACVFHSPPPPDSVPTCSSAGILGSVAGMLGSIQATEVLKMLLGIGEPLYNTILSFDALNMEFRKICVSKNPQCRVCGNGGPKTLSDYEQASCWEL
ncbi:HesA/MoeB/ThiF family protein [Helicobacter equorum]|uniref:HesA/MoeB/ThiF family protein n=1 Tax=Helicobacter equorum TaxID=361872 RepID=UPI000CF075E5|nr:molybdopterin-synthase adenylyltransferase MoeB [Helicobacter equorum]